MKAKNVLIVLSGKGGVGKSCVATNLAWTLVKKQLKVGLLDIDLCGPSIAKIMGVEDQDVHQSSAGWVPVYTDASKQLGVMSIAFLLKNKDDPVIWRGPKKNAMIKQFLNDVAWEDIDFLIIDTPPGTSDEHITVMESLREIQGSIGAVLVTTPQGVAISDVRREITFCRKANIPIVGLIENMSGYTCPHCQECTNIFSSGGGESLAAYAQIPFLGSLPMEPLVTKAMEKGENINEKHRGTEIVQRLDTVAQNVLDQLNKLD